MLSGSALGESALESRSLRAWGLARHQFIEGEDLYRLVTLGYAQMAHNPAALFEINWNLARRFSIRPLLERVRQTLDERSPSECPEIQG